MEKPQEKQKCCFEGCQRTGIPEPDCKYYACDECLENLERLMNEEFANAMNKMQPGWKN
jgi:hypothetical protein